MVRQHVQPRTTFAAPGGEQGDELAPVRQPTARLAATMLRLIVAPFAAVAAGIAGLAFAALLPICGIATICEGIAKASWRFARDAFARVSHLRLRRT